jgi:hypothetical protein
VAIDCVDYNTNVEEHLKRRKSPVNKLRFGCEIETGWRTDTARQKFLTSLEDSGLDGLVVAKYDRSIPGDSPAEIVSIPLEISKLQNLTLLVGKEIERNAHDVILSKCGVHIHVTRQAVPELAMWRAVYAIMETAAEDFWTLLALRGENEYCLRREVATFKDFTALTHHMAVSVSKTKPTVEFRLFKSCRSATVLASYVDTVSALIHFCSAPPPELLPPTAPGVSLERRDELMRKLNLCAAAICRRYYATECGIGGEKLESYVAAYTEQVRKSLIQGIVAGHWGKFAQKDYVHEYVNDLKPHFVDIMRLGEVDPLDQKPWKDGFPLKAFCEFVLAQSAMYPSLAKRLQLPKFLPFYTSASMPAKSVQRFDCDSPHERIRAGCLVHCDLDRTAEPQLFRVQSYKLRDDVITTEAVYSAEHYAAKLLRIVVKGTSPADETFDVTTKTFGDSLIHLCAGALTKEGHDE